LLHRGDTPEQDRPSPPKTPPLLCRIKALQQGIGAGIFGGFPRDFRAASRSAARTGFF
jgi:hypothetical protein